MKKLSLTDRFTDSIEIEDCRYTLDLSFDNVLRVFELFSDEDFTSTDKVDLITEMLVVSKLDHLRLSTLDKDKIIVNIFKEFLDMDLTKVEDLNTDKERFIDLYEDAERIYAMFLKEYQMDLFDYHGKLHFKRFSALLNQGIERDLKEVVEIRASKIPAPTKHNTKERERLIKLKHMYKLDNVDDPELIIEKVDNTLDKVADFFRPKK